MKICLQTLKIPLNALKIEICLQVNCGARVKLEQTHTAKPGKFHRDFM